MSSKQIQLKTPVPGPRSTELRKVEDQHMAPGTQGFALMAGIVVDHAKGSTVTDVDGNRFIDIIGGIGVNGLGHSHPTYVAALKDQLEKVSVGSFTSAARVELMQRIAEHAPAPGLHRLQLYSGGSEAVESALRLAKAKTQKFEVVSFWGGFHGKTLGTMSLMGSPSKQGYGPLAPGSHVVPYANCYRCPFKKEPGSCAMECVSFAKQQIKMQSAGQVAAVIIEPMQGTAGNVIPPKEFLPAVKEMAKEMGALLIVDEMITGFGRTGKYWGAQHSGVEADIVTLGKQFGGGYPMSGLLSKDEIVNTKPWSEPSGSSSSYGGNAMAARAAATALKIIDEEGLVENSRKMGELFLKRLQPMREKYPFVGEVRGAGLFMAIELVKDKTSKEPLSKNVCNRVFNECLKRGLLTMAYAASFRIQPSMTIDEATVNEAADVLFEVFDSMKSEGWWNS